MRCLHLARTAILSRVAGFGKNVVPLLRLWTWDRRFGIRTQSVKCFLEYRSLVHGTIRVALEICLRPMMKTVDAREVAFREQVRFGLQPVSYTHLRAHETPEHL